MFAHGFRTVLVLLTAALLTLPAETQETPLSVPRAIGLLVDNFGSGILVRHPIPESADAVNISAYTMDASEPGASCTSSPLSHSAWFKITHPGGTLDIDTSYSSGSGFDSVVQLFADDTSSLAALRELGCDNNGGSSSPDNDARLVMPNLPSASYIVRITCIALCAGTTDLALAITYTPNKAPPAHDQVSAAKVIQIGKADLTKRAEFTTLAATEYSTLTCPMYYSVWYTMTVPANGSYSFSSFGSSLKRDVANPADTKLAVYVSSGGATFANFTEEGCSDDYGSMIGYGALPAITLDAGEEVFVRVGSFSEQNMLAGSHYRFKASIVTLSNVFTNPSFETGTLAPWKMSTTSASEGVTNTVVNSGIYSARMVGGPGKTNTLKQKWSLGSIRLPKDSTVVASFAYSTNNTVSNKVTATLTMTYKGSPAQSVKVKLNKQASSFHILYLHLPVKAANVKDITLTFKNKSSGGQIFIDAAVLRLYGDPTRSVSQSSDLLPVPEAPPLPLRGTN